MSNKIYIGFTTDVDRRLIEHNSLDNTGYTFRYRPWKLIYFEAYEDRNTAINREKQFKRHGNTTSRLKTRLGISVKLGGIN